MKSKIQWRFHVLKSPKRKDEWNWFSIYYAELLGLNALKDYIVDESKSVGDSFKEALIVNPRSGWASIAAAIKTKQRVNVKIVLRILENVVEEYTELKDYQKLYIEAMILLEKNSEARKTMNILEKNFQDDADVMILKAKMHIAQAKKELAKEVLAKARKKYQYNKEIWQMQKDLNK